MESVSKRSLLFNIYCLVLFFLFIASIIFSKGQDVLFINGKNNLFFDQFFPLITNLGDGVIFVLIILATLFIRFQYTTVAVSVLVAHGILVSLFKRILFSDLDRPRNYLDNNLLHFVKGVTVHSNHSFPSGHTTTAFCAALLIALISKNKTIGIITLVIALLVGYSRIYLLQHFLIDVAAGAIIGCFTTYLIWQIMEANQKPGWMNKQLRISFKQQPKSRRLA